MKRSGRRTRRHKRWEFLTQHNHLILDNAYYYLCVEYEKHHRRPPDYNEGYPDLCRWFIRMGFSPTWALEGSKGTI